MHNYLRYFAGASLLILMLGLAVFNVKQWLFENFIVLAVIALCAELIGFVMAVMTEIAFRSKRFVAGCVCLLILVVCAGFNVIGAERAWDASMQRHLETQRLEAQREIDTSRADLQAKLSAANTIVASYSHLLPGSDTVRARQAGMQRAWTQATEQARTDAAKAQRDLDAMPIVATVAAPFTTWQVRLGFSLAELIKALGLWACGFGAVVISSIVSETTKKETTVTAETSAETGGETQTETNVVSLVTMKARACALREQEKLSYSKIAAEVGCSKKHAWMLVNT